MRIWERGLAVAIGFVLTVFLVAATAQASADAERKPDRVCGLEPGEGAYNFTKVWDVSCRDANKVARTAFFKFCGDEFQDCMPMPGDVIKGRTSVKGWSCEMTVAYEFGRAKCGRNGARFVREYGA